MSGASLRSAFVDRVLLSRLAEVCAAGLGSSARCLRALLRLLRGRAYTPDDEPEVFYSDCDDSDCEEDEDTLGADAAPASAAEAAAPPQHRRGGSLGGAASSPLRGRSASFGGALPSAHWRDGDATSFVLRSTSYLLDKQKRPSAPAVLTLAAVELLEPAAPTEHLAAHPNTWLRRGRSALGAAQPGAPPPFTLLINFMNPGAPGKVPYTSLCLYFQPRDRASTLSALLAQRTPFAASLRRFLAADADTRAGMLKLIAAVASGPMLLRAAVPRTPVLIGRHVGMAVHLAADESYLEIDLDVSSSPVGDRFYRHLFRHCAGQVVTEIACLFEGATEEELPEQCFGVAHLAKIGPQLARRLHPR